MDKAGNYTVVAHLEGWSKTESFQITVQETQPKEILNVNVPNRQYVAAPNTALNLEGATLEVLFNNGRTYNIAIDPSWCSAVDLTTVGQKEVTVTYEGLTATFNVTAKRALTSIEFEPPASHTAYVQGNEFSLSPDEEGRLVANFSDGMTVHDIELTKEMCSGYNLNIGGPQKVTVTYTVEATDEVMAGSATTEYEIYVTGIAMSEGPTKANYELGEAFDGTGITVTFYNYNKLGGNEGKVVTWESGMLSVEGFDPNSEAVQSITLVYTDADGHQYKQVGAFEVTVGHPDAQPGDGSQGGADANGQTGTNNPITGTAAGGITMIVALIVVAAILFRVYRLRVKR